MRVLVTGGAGFIGSHIVDLLVERGHDVLVVDDLSSGRRENINPAAKTTFVDITDYAFIQAARHFRPQAICHQAAQPSLRRSIDHPIDDARVNILGTLAIIQAARQVGAYVVMASTSAVYDPGASLPYREDAPIGPRLPYGIAKAAAEMYLRNSGLLCAVLRYGNVYGPRQQKVGENQLVPHCLGHLLRGDPFAINGDGEQTRDFVYVGDVVQANVYAIETGIEGVYNIATNQETTVNRVCEILAGACGMAGYAFKHDPAKAGEARHVRLDNHQSSFWWKWTIDVEEGLALAVKSCQPEPV